MQHRGRGEIVVPHIGLDVTEVRTEPHHRGLVADCVNASQRPLHDRAVGEVAPDVGRRGVQIVGSTGVRGGMEQVEDHDIIAALDQRIDDVRPDESRSAGDQDPSHSSTLPALGAVPDPWQ